MPYAYLTKEQFVATRHAPTDEEWKQLTEYAAEGALFLPPRDNCILYAEMHLIHKAGDGFYSHASWWYKPNRNATLEEAEDDQYKWYCEFMDAPN